MQQLEELLSEPTPEVVEALRNLQGDLIVLGAAGKMGPTLARMAQRALEKAGSGHRVIAASRFSSPESRTKLERWDLKTIACDLLDREQVARLPDAPNVVFMAGMKFGTTGQEALTWATNTLVPAFVCEKFRGSRISLFSTGNVYGLTPVDRGGSTESDPLEPLGDYAMSCVGRERIFEHSSRTFGTPVAILRLNYACDLRYGVLVDLARRVEEEQPVDLTMGCFNTIWQGDANAVALRALAHASSPPFVVNVTGPELLSVRRVSELLGALLEKPVTFVGSEAADAFLSNAEKAHKLFGLPRVAAEQLIRRVADWVKRGGESLAKPTHFEVRHGKF